LRVEEGDNLRAVTFSASRYLPEYTKFLPIAKVSWSQNETLLLARRAVATWVLSYRKNQRFSE
jgi:hypothetical protein